VADAVLAAANRPAATGHVYDVAGPTPMMFIELLRIAARAVASRTRFIPVPLYPVLAVARAYELLSQHPKIRADQMRCIAEDTAFSNDQAVSDLDYAPRSFAEGIRAEACAMGLVGPARSTI
jgi:nucleoside-diphosphate-sugar epimerase